MANRAEPSDPPSHEISLYTLSGELQCQVQRPAAPSEQPGRHLIRISCLRSPAVLLVSTKLIPETKNDRALEIAKELARCRKRVRRRTIEQVEQSTATDQSTRYYDAFVQNLLLY